MRHGKKINFSRVVVRIPNMASYKIERSTKGNEILKHTSPVLRNNYILLLRYGLFESAGKCEHMFGALLK